MKTHLSLLHFQQKTNKIPAILYCTKAIRNRCIVRVIMRTYLSLTKQLLVLLFTFQNISTVWRIPIVSDNLIGIVPEVKHKKLFTLNITEPPPPDHHQIIRIRMLTNMKSNFSISMSYNLQYINFHDGIIYALLVLVGLYILIIFEVYVSLLR